ncbi:MAG: GGDEF domain-containing protein, partial [Veillonellales bacterium]
IETEESFSVLYFDLDNFKAYNDVYGFENGDKILRMTASIIQEQMDQSRLNDSFLGHIGGDDFIAVVRQPQVEALCQMIIDSFDARVKDFYTEEHQQQGFITAKNRHGTEERFPLTSLSIAVVSSRKNVFTTITQLAETAGRVKKKCKLTWQSCYCLAEHLGES